jgi:hypothetical protein
VAARRGATGAVGPRRQGLQQGELKAAAPPRRRSPFAEDAGHREEGCGTGRADADAGQRRGRTAVAAPPCRRLEESQRLETVAALADALEIATASSACDRERRACSIVDVGTQLSTLRDISQTLSSCLSLLDTAVFATAGLECCGACLTLINSWPVFEFNLNSTKEDCYTPERIAAQRGQERRIWRRHVLLKRVGRGHVLYSPRCVLTQYSELDQINDCTAQLD